jgi:hypothetical protein
LRQIAYIAPIKTAHQFLLINVLKNKAVPINIGTASFVVRMKGLEPPRREAPDPKSGAATNYATSAIRIYFGLQR